MTGSYYIGQTKAPLAKEWRLVAKGDDPMEVAKKTTALALSLIHI